MKALEDSVKIFESPDDRELLLEEARSDGDFARLLSRTLELPDGEKRVAMSARKAVLNELNPGLYRETRGRWMKLRASVKDLIAFAGERANGGSAAPVIREHAIKKLSGLGDLGQWDIIGSIVGAVAGAASNAYSTSVQAKTAQQIQQMQLDAQMRQLQVQQNIAKVQAAEQAQQASVNPLVAVQSAASNIVDTISQPVAGGIPLWAVLLGVFLLAEKA